MIRLSTTSVRTQSLHASLVNFLQCCAHIYKHISLLVNSVVFLLLVSSIV